MHSQIVLAIIRVHGLAYLCESLGYKDMQGRVFR